VLISVEKRERVLVVKDDRLLRKDKIWWKSGRKEKIDIGKIISGSDHWYNSVNEVRSVGDELGFDDLCGFHSEH
jgi:hypothetical protein